MFKCRDALLIAAIGSLVLDVPAYAQEARYRDIGRAATQREIRAWDIDVRPDFQGLPKGSGTAVRGQVIWEKQCAACHGVFGESGEFSSPIVGGTTAEDIRTGHVARLADPSYPERTTLMQLTTVSTLWDYIRRAMPWNAPKSLSSDEVYAVTAYLLFMGGIVAEDFVLSDSSIGEAQARLPNRNGATTNHAMWPGRTLGGRAADTRNVACMTDCETLVEVSSSLPADARNAHGNLADQSRIIGPQRGADTSKPAASTLRESADAEEAHRMLVNAGEPGAMSISNASRDLPQKFACTTCHDSRRKVFGPAFQEIAKKYRGDPDAARYLAGKIRSGGHGVWGEVAMPPQDIDQLDATRIGQWLADGAR